MVKLPFAPSPLIALLVVGCGGSGGGSSDPRSVSVSAASSAVRVGSSTLVTVAQHGYGEPSYSLQVLEGDSGGTLSPSDTAEPQDGIREVYTAPDAPGTYHVLGSVTDAMGKLYSKTVAITVTAAPQS